MATALNRQDGAEAAVREIVDVAAPVAKAGDPS
jgi:hypothetical protein